MPWTFPPRPSKLQTNLQTNADKSADKVCLDSNLTNLFKNADARAAKIHQNADKPCLPKLQTRFVCCRQMLSILDLALFGRWAIRVLRPSGAGRPCYPKTPTPAPEGRKTEIALRVRVARDSRKPQRPRPSGAIALNARGFGRARTKGFGRRPSGVARPMAHEKVARQRFMKVRVRYETR